MFQVLFHFALSSLFWFKVIQGITKNWTNISKEFLYLKGPYWGSGIVRMHLNSVTEALSSAPAFLVAPSYSFGVPWEYPSGLALPKVFMLLDPSLYVGLVYFDMERLKKPSSCKLIPLWEIIAVYILWAFIYYSR